MANFDNVRQLVHDMKYCTNKLLLNGFETLEVDNIIDSKISKDQKRHYLVCFKSWLPEDHLDNYNDLIEDYWRKRQEDAKKWKGSQDGESDKENNFISPTSSKTKRSFLVSPPQAQPASDNSSNNDKVKFLDNCDSNGLDSKELRLDIPGENEIKSEENSDADEYDNFPLNIDEPTDHSSSTFIRSQNTRFVDRLIHSGTPSHSSPNELSYEDSVCCSGTVPMYNEGSHEVDGNSIEYLAKPSYGATKTHLLKTFQISSNDDICVDSHRSKLDDIPIIESICNEELPDFDVKRQADMLNGNRHIDEYDVPRSEDGRLSLYSDDPIDGEHLDGEQTSEFEETLLEEDRDVSDTSEFGLDENHPDESYDHKDKEDGDSDRTASDVGEIIPATKDLNKYTPLNSVQVNHETHISPCLIPQSSEDSMGASTFINKLTQPSQDNCENSVTGNVDDSCRQVIGNTTPVADIHTGLNHEQSKVEILPVKVTKKRKGKTLDDIVRKISSANEQAEKKALLTDEDSIENEMRSENDTSWANVGDIQAVKKELSGEENDQESNQQSQCDAELTISTYEGNRENNVYWSAGKAFHKRNISYKCKFCEHRFDDDTLLKDHERSHGQHQCRNCNEFFSTSIALFEHREVAHAFKPRQRYNKCRFCPTLYADPAMLQRHEDIHHLSRSSISPSHRDDSMNDLPPPLMSIDENHRKFPRYENQRELNSNENNYRPRSPREMRPVRNTSEIDQYQRIETTMDNGEGKSIVRNPIRNLLGKMYHTQKKMEPNAADRYSPHLSACRSKMTSPHRFHYVNYPRCYPGSLSKSSPEHAQREVRECRMNIRSGAIAPVEEDRKDYRELLHICSICNKSFGMKDRLEQHWLTVHPDTITYSCEVCHEIFIDKDNLDTHMSIHLKQDYYCGYCRKTFECRASYETHMRAHSNDRPFRCHICGRAFSLRTNLRRHVLIHTDITPYRCHVCFKGFRRSDMLSSHVKQYHVGNNDKKCQNFEQNDPVCKSEEHHENQNTNESVSPVFQPLSGSNSPYTPRHENKVANGHDSYINTSPSQANDDPIVYPIESRIKHSPDSVMINHSPNSPRMGPSPNITTRHDSGDISAISHSMVSLTHLPKVVGMHQISNDPTFHRPNGMLTPMGSGRASQQLVASSPAMKQAHFNPYKTNLVNILPLPVASSRMDCNECGEKFTSESLYEIHLQSHVKEASYTCRKCRRTFSGKSQYNSHMQTHENNKSHSCPYCHRSFSMKGNLRRHIRIHTNEAPYECPICFQRFRRSDGLKGHIKRHDAMGESAPGDMVPSQAST